MKSAHSASSFHSSSHTAAHALACLLLLCATPIATPAQSTDPSQQVIEHIHGVVINAVDKKPVARALVSSSDQRMAIMTDSDGRFTFDIHHPATNSPSGMDSMFSMGISGPMSGASQIRTALMARRPGYLVLNTVLRLPPDPKSASEDIQLKLIPECTIRGHLSIPNGAPAGLQVQLRRRQVQDGVAVWAQTGAAQTNSHGDYRFAELPAGDYKLMTQAWSDRSSTQTSASDESSGYAPAYYADTADLASSPPIHLATGEAIEADLNPRAVTLYHVTIPLPNVAKGSGVGVTVGDLNELSGYFLGFNSQTQRIEGFLPNGAFDIHVNSFGQAQTSGFGRVEVAGRPVKAPPITLLPNGQISVIVRQDFTANDTPGTGSSAFTPIQAALRRRPVEVFLRPVGSQGSPSANLNNSEDENDNTLVLDNVQQGTYRVVATPHRGYVASMTSDGVDLMRQPLVVGPGGASQPINITLRDDAATLTGSLSPPNPTATPSDPDTGFVVTCIPLENGLATPAAQMNGFGAKFTIPNLAPGQYLVLAISMSLSNVSFRSIEYLNPDVLRNYESKGTVVTLTPGQKAEIQVPLLPASESESEN